MGCKVLCPSVYLLAYLMICDHVQAECTQPSFASRNVVLSANHLSTQNFPNGSTVTFECVIGHKLVDRKASRSVTCEGNQWTSLELSCTRKSCGSLADFFDGRYDMTGNLFGDTAKPVCNQGYMLAGKETTRTCRDQGWDGRDPLCEPVKCSAPPAIENGQLVDEPLESYNYLEEVSYRCNKGINLIGKSTLRCSEDGTFKPDPPKCFALPTPPTTTTTPTTPAISTISKPPKENGKSCGSLADFLHGRYDMTGNLFGDTAKPVCDKGYMLAGKETTRTCRDQGWDGRDPLCEPVKCSAPPAIENGQLVDEPLESYNYLEAVSYRCNKGINLIGASTLHCSEDGTFKPDPPKCFGKLTITLVVQKMEISNNSIITKIIFSSI
uniref:Sushi domain-containing protein n=1 Tax=Cyprinus carpio TaxID=7962 RepID=A0A8C1Y067_CYPCA